MFCLISSAGSTLRELADSCAYNLFPSPSSPGIALEWRWLAVLCSFPPCLMVIFMSFMPETPRYLLNRNKHPEAIAALKFLRGPHVDHEWELRQIETSAEEQVIRGFLGFLFKFWLLFQRSAE